jgi:hypothetical protein
MKKMVTGLLLVTTLACTKKGNKTCWRCALSEQNTGRPLPTKDTCTESDPTTFHFYDANGNPLNVTCAKK